MQIFKVSFDNLNAMKTSYNILSAVSKVCMPPQNTIHSFITVPVIALF